MKKHLRRTDSVLIAPVIRYLIFLYAGLRNCCYGSRSLWCHFRRISPFPITANNGIIEIRHYSVCLKVINTVFWLGYVFTVCIWKQHLKAMTQVPMWCLYRSKTILFFLTKTYKRSREDQKENNLIQKEPAAHDKTSSMLLCCQAPVSKKQYILCILFNCWIGCCSQTHVPTSE